MNTAFYPKLAIDNIRKNSRSYIPYILTCIFTVAMYYIMKSLSLNKGLDSVRGTNFVCMTLGFGSYIIAIFAFIFLFYTNGFLMKNRKKEFGLFNILGMEKKHIAKVIFYESLFVFVISIILGFGLGILLDKLMYLLITKIIHAEITLGFYISIQAITSSLILFGILFLFIFLNSVRLIHLSKPIELLKGGSVGEKEPKTKILMTLLGIICLGAGYYIAVTVESPLLALSLFFVAVVLVIIGTYLLLTAGSIALLKLLKKNKSYYYKTRHFISVSGMIYRMKQNAVGLANICILSTMVLVMVSSTASLMIGLDDIIMEQNPYQYEFAAFDVSEETFGEIIEIIHETAASENITIEKQSTYSSLAFSALVDGDDFVVSSGIDLIMIGQVQQLYFITAEHFSQFIGEKVSLADNEVILWYNRNPYDEDHFNLFGKRYNIVGHTEKFVGNGMASANITPTFGIVVKDRSVIDYLCAEQEKVYDTNSSCIISYCEIDIDGDAKTQIMFSDKIRDNTQKYIDDNDIDRSIRCREDLRSGTLELYGSLFFLGIFLGLLFTMATVLLIYYKQISEGYDDKKRFEIMQKVGMSEHEVKSSIHSQILTVFFLPLILAGIHMSFAFPIIKKLLTLFQLSNVSLLLLCTAGTYLIFALIYGAIYALTARVYYRIVKK